ncbi:putative Lipase 3 [Daphnia magna]|uniref:Putative Lipase 3 n=1 Tax=Daphnia magna TaxID=35525 RepID=A0A164RUA5_9CRUS|nr:putative Lipase 3 [Daphnia magna]
MAPKVSGQPVFLQHGLMNSDNVWLLLPDALAFTLADAGYDVWLGNARGNTYSRRHVSLDPSQEDYWNFSFDEMGNYDIPAVINFVLTKTGSEKMSYVGHSMGCTMFFICMSLHPELNDKIDVMIALAPAVSMAKSTAPLMVNQAPFAPQIKNTLFSSSGDDYHSLDLNLLPIIDGHNPAGTSVNTAVHYAQNYMAGMSDISTF